MNAPPPLRVEAPAGYITAQLAAFANVDGDGVHVSGTNPLPVAGRTSAATSTPLTGSANASGTTPSFDPELGRPVWVTLTGTWTGTVRVVRSTDGGATWSPLTVAGGSWGQFTANCNEPVTEEGDAAATYALSMTLSSGTVSYRVAQ